MNERLNHWVLQPIYNSSHSQLPIIVIHTTIILVLSISFSQSVTSDPLLAVCLLVCVSGD